MAGNGIHLRRKDLQGYGEASNLKMNEEIKELIQQGKQIYHLGFGQSPFPVPEELHKALQKHAHHNDYVSMKGIVSLREAILHHHNSFPTGIPDSLLSLDNIIVCDGTKMLIYLIMAVTDVVVVLLAPSWTTYLPQATLAGKKKMIVESSFECGWKLTPKSLRQTIVSNGKEQENMLVVLTNPGNPTGALYTADELRELSEVFREYKMTVISDEIYSLLTFSDEYVSVSKFYPEGTIVTTGLSKWASTGGWRVGYAMFPPELSLIRDTVCSAASHTYSCCAAPQQWAAAEFLNEIEASRNFAFHTKRILKAVSEMCVRKFTEVGVRVHNSYAGYYIYPDFSNHREKLAGRSITTGKELCDAIFAEAKVSLLPGALMHLERPEALTARLCYVNFDGGKALEASREIGEVDLDENFINRYCKPTVEAMDILASWCRGVMES